MANKIWKSIKRENILSFIDSEEFVAEWMKYNSALCRMKNKVEFKSNFLIINFPFSKGKSLDYFFFENICGKCCKETLRDYAIGSWCAEFGVTILYNNHFEFIFSTWRTLRNTFRNDTIVYPGRDVFFWYLLDLINGYGNRSVYLPYVNRSFIYCGMELVPHFVNNLKANSVIFDTGFGGSVCKKIIQVMPLDLNLRWVLACYEGPKETRHIHQVGVTSRNKRIDIVQTVHDIENAGSFFVTYYERSDIRLHRTLLQREKRPDPPKMLYQTIHAMMHFVDNVDRFVKYCESGGKT